MIWQDMSFDDKQTLINKYNDIRKNIKKLNSAKANTEKKAKYTELQLKDYNDKVKELQEQYNEIKIQYRCDYCNSIIDLPFDKIKNLLKGKEDPIFCDRKCSGSYYAYKSHEGKTEKQEQERRDKISKSLKEYETTLSFKEKQNKYLKLNSFWNNLDKEERSNRNKLNSKKALDTMIKNNSFGCSKDEYLIYNELKNNLAIKHQYYIKGFNFDFMILENNEITLIELNGVYWHNKRPFSNTTEDINEYNEMISIGGQRLNIANKWRYMDVAKLNFCKENNFNYICIYFDNNEIKKEYKKVCKIIKDNINKGIIIITKDILAELLQL